MNNRISSRLNASSRRCAYSNDRRLCRRPTTTFLRNRRRQTVSLISTGYYLQQIEALASRLSLETERQLEEKRTAWREGRKDEARVWLYQAKSDQAVWERLAESVRARVLRFEARVELDLTGKTYLPMQLADEADRLAPETPDKVLLSYIALYDQDIETALALVADDDTVIEMVYDRMADYDGPHSSMYSCLKACTCVFIRVGCDALPDLARFTLIVQPAGERTPAQMLHGTAVPRNN